MNPVQVMNDGHLLGALGAELNAEFYQIIIHHELEVNLPDLDLAMLKEVADTDQSPPGSSGTAALR
jgi:hypothetical protein